MLVLWAQRGMIPRPSDYESAALTNWAMGPTYKERVVIVLLINITKVLYKFSNIINYLKAMLDLNQRIRGFADLAIRPLW